ncbi:hypothetical protein AURANDRAFT_12350, partial [Aureococcus anophagefferens]
GYGKLILLGEHFVVYKVPALVAAVGRYTDCDVALEAGAGIEVADHRPAVPGYKAKKGAEGRAAVALVLDHLGVDYAAQKVKLTFGGDLTAARGRAAPTRAPRAGARGTGIGASAAQVVALARALGQAVPALDLDEDAVNAAGYEGEKGYHGTPSGIDNTAATFGGVLKFARTAGAPKFEKKALPAPIRVVYASTGITASTTAVVADVAAKRESDPAWFDGLLQSYVGLLARAEAALDAGDVAALGACLDENHALCQKLTVSCAELDALVLAARGAGAAGAKMSGTGRGGLMIALAPDEQAEAAIKAALEALAP